MSKEREKLIKKYYYIIGQIGLIQANINYAKKFKYDPIAQSAREEFKDIKKLLEADKKRIKKELKFIR